MESPPLPVVPASPRAAAMPQHGSIGGVVQKCVLGVGICWLLLLLLATEGKWARGAEPDGEAPLTSTYLCIGILSLVSPYLGAEIPCHQRFETLCHHIIRPFFIVFN